MKSRLGRFALWIIATVGELVAAVVTLVSTFVTLIVGILLFGLCLVFSNEHITPLIPFMPDTWDIYVSTVLAIVGTMIGMVILELLLIVVLVLILAAIIGLVTLVWSGVRAIVRS